MANFPVILLIDDDKDFLDILSLKLQAEGFNIVTASSGQDGLAALRQMTPNLVLLDIEMPVMNGFETFAQIKSNPATANLKVVFLTSYGEPVPADKARNLDVRFAQEIGATSYIRKTDDLDEIAKKVRELTC